MTSKMEEGEKLDPNFIMTQGAFKDTDYHKVSCHRQQL